MRVRVDYDKEPRIAVGEEIEVKIVFKNRLICPFNADVRLILPEGLTSSSNGGRVFIDHQRQESGSYAFTLTATEALKANNRVIVEVDSYGHAGPALFAIPIFSK